MRLKTTQGEKLKVSFDISIITVTILSKTQMGESVCHMY